MIIFTIFEILFEIWNLFHWSHDPDEMSKFQSLSFKNQIQEMKFRFAPLMIKVFLLLYMMEDIS